MKLPVLYAVVTERGTLSFDGGGDPIVFTRPYRAIAACSGGERVVAYNLVPATATRDVAQLQHSLRTKPYAE